jgi:serine/threonine protein kinase HipA of HipAB toxin-antitoxin module
MREGRKKKGSHAKPPRRKEELLRVFAFLCGLAALREHKNFPIFMPRDGPRRPSE